MAGPAWQHGGKDVFGHGWSPPARQDRVMAVTPDLVGAALRLVKAGTTAGAGACCGVSGGRCKRA